MQQSNRFSQLEKLLHDYREQIYGKERALAKAPDEEKVRIKQQIVSVKNDMQPYLEEYWSIASDKADEIEVSEQEAETAIAEIVKTANSIESLPSVYSSEIIDLLIEIRDKLKQTDTPAAAKLKGIISSFPPFIGISYEAELDTEKFLVQKFPTICELITRMAKKKA